MGTEVWEGVIGGTLLDTTSLWLCAQLGSTGIGSMGARSATLFLMCRGGAQGLVCTAGMLRYRLRNVWRQIGQLRVEAVCAVGLGDGGGCSSGGCSGSIGRWCVSQRVTIRNRCSSESGCAPD
jgi:hypothetical protein